MKSFFSKLNAGLLIAFLVLPSLFSCGGAGAPPASIPAPVSQKLSISPPGPNGAVVISGAAGAVQPFANVEAKNVTQLGPFPFLENLLIRKAYAQIFQAQVQADSQGAFTLQIDGASGDRIDVRQEVNGDFSPPVSLTVP